ncbi:MAG: L,D-transpeptidase [Ferruginibacter sp.]
MKISRVYPMFFLCSIFAMVSFVPGRNKKLVLEKRSNALRLIRNTVLARSNENPYYIIVDKSDYELKVYDEEGWYATYPIVFGSKDLRDKMKEGDKRTPDGHFKVIQKKIHPKWSYELLLDFPNEECIKRFNERKSRGLLPKNSKIGSGIAIHATRPEEEWTVDNFYNWTDGCVSVKYTEMKDLYSFIPVGTPVTIQQ